MIGMLYISLAVVTMVLSCASKKNFNKNSPIFFSFCCCVFADLTFLIISGFNLNFNILLLPYTLLFTLSYSVATIFIILAYKWGSFSFSSLVISFSLILPTLYGILLLGDKTTWCFYLGLVLLAIATVLLTVNVGEVKINSKPINVKWIFAIFMAFIANGFCSIFQTAEQLALNNMYKNELMIMSLTLSSIIFLILSIIFEKKEIIQSKNQALKYGFFSGIMNGLSNLFVMFSVNNVKTSVVFPLISGGGLVLSFLYAIIIYKEKYSLRQYIGFIISIASVVLLNI